MNKKYIYLYLSPLMVSFINFLIIFFGKKNINKNGVDERFKYIIISLCIITVLFFIIYIIKNKLDFLFKRLLVPYTFLVVLIILGSYLFL